MFKVKELERAPKWDGHTPQDAIERLSRLSADAVEVVRCKDCKYYKSVAVTCGNCYQTTHPVHPEDYCSRGIRKGKYNAIT